MKRCAWGLALAILLAGCIGIEPLDEPVGDGFDKGEIKGLNEGFDEGDIEGFNAPRSEPEYDEITHIVKYIPSTVDGAELRVDIYKPQPDGTYPTILILTPYRSFIVDNKDDEVNDGYPTWWYVDYFAPRGYAVAVGEMRSTGDSGGCWDFGGELDQQDGHDIVQALAAETWSDGKVGMLGASHAGMSQIAAAVTAPPNLTTIVPIQTVSDWYGYLHMDGTQYVDNRITPPAYFLVHASPSTDPVTDANITTSWVKTQANTACEDNIHHTFTSTEFDGDKDAYWAERDFVARADNINASVFLVHGFQDENTKTDHFHRLWEALPDDVDKRGWFGQFGHVLPYVHEWRNEVHAWFDHELKGIPNGIMDGPAVTTQNSNGTAHMEADWPPPNVENVGLRLGGDKLAIDQAPPPGQDAIKAPQNDVEEQTVTYRSVPGNDRPLPAYGTDRQVTFSTDAVQEPVYIVGEPRLTLQGVLDQPFGHWIAVLYEVKAGYELGDWEGVEEITRSYLDAEHRDGNEQGDPVPVGEVLKYTMRFFPRDHVVEEGNRIVLALVGGDMGCQLGVGACEGTGIVPQAGPVTHTVHVGPEAGSVLEIPVQPSMGPVRELTPLDGWLEETPE